GMLAKGPYVMSHMYATDDGAAWFQPMTVTGSLKGLVGVASAAIASGCIGWVTVRGLVDDASSPASVDFTGSIGDAVFFAGTSGLGASSSTYLGAVHQIGFLAEDLSTVGATNQANIFLTGNQLAQAM
ncbi:hypothetical protein LCGC14_3149310, partial [marine sediment metagenome]